MPKNIVDVFIRVFSKLPQRVIWKWEADIPENIPSNIMLVDWIPQQDLLGKFTLVIYLVITVFNFDYLMNYQDIQTQNYSLLMVACWVHKKRLTMVSQCLACL